MKSHVLIVLALWMALSGCSHDMHVPVHIIVLPDVSASIDFDSQREAFRAIAELIPQLKRGDSLTVVPVLSDAEVEAQGRILRFQVSEHRDAYDADLKRFRQESLKRLAAFRQGLLSVPAEKTDLLGTSTVAEQEFAGNPAPSDRVLIVLSDFIEDDGTVNFKTDPRLTDKVKARRFAQALAADHSTTSKPTRVYLGELRSRELGDLSKTRRAAIQTFWISYFAQLGIPSRFFTDGPAAIMKAVAGK